MKNYKIHIFIWIFYFLLAYVSDSILNKDTRLSAELIIFLTHNVFLFYSFYFVIKNASFNSFKSTILSIGSYLLVVLVFFGFKYLISYKILHLIYGPFTDLPLIQVITTIVLWIINYTIFAFAYYYFTGSIKKQKEINALLTERLTQEKEKLELENVLLRAQINPHFLYNTLNLFYAKAIPLSNELSNGILLLSDIMRYSLRPLEDGLVLLNDEIEHIQNILEIARLRFNDKVYVSFTLNGSTEDYKIIPFALITLVENVLKHGLINVPNNPAKITLTIDNNQCLHFSTNNVKRFGPKESSTSIGLKNTIKRLENAYGSDAQLEIIDTEHDFQINLFINLAQKSDD